MIPPLGERIKRLRSKQDDDWFSLAIAGPIAFFLNAWIVEVRWISPNLLTLIGFAMRIACCPLLLQRRYDADVAVAILFTLATILDVMDGSLARYRGKGSLVGAFLDKSLDIIAMMGLMACMGHRLLSETGEASAFFLCFFLAAGFACRSYLYWVVAFAEAERGAQPTVGPRLDQSFPDLTFAQRVVLYVKRSWRVAFLLDEGDLYFLLSLALLLRILPETVKILAGMMGVSFVGIYSYRLITAARLDRVRAPHG